MSKNPATTAKEPLDYFYTIFRDTLLGLKPSRCLHPGLQDRASGLFYEISSARLTAVHSLPPPPHKLLKRVTLFIFFLLLPAVTQAQSQKYFYIAPAIECAYFGRDTPAVGFGGEIGTEDRVSIGIRCVFAQSFDEEKISSLEITIFQRFYLLKNNEVKGLFAQVNLGCAVITDESEMSFPAPIGTVSAGVTAGWRFLLGRSFFVEPYVRAGYPYFAGGGLSVGIKF